MPLSVKLAACLDMLGLTGKTINWDHDPPLAMRERTEDGGYIPAANDARFIRPLIEDDHDAKTNGTHVPLSGDKSKIAKLKRVEDKAEAFRNRILAKEPGREKPKSRWASRPFQRKKKS